MKSSAPSNKELVEKLIDADLILSQLKDALEEESSITSVDKEQVEKVKSILLDVRLNLESSAPSNKEDQWPISLNYDQYRVGALVHRIINSDRRAEFSRVYRLTKGDEYRAMQRRNQKTYQQRLKEKVMVAYSNTSPPSCACCGVNEIEFLSIDHINGGGLRHIREIKFKFYNWLISKNFPEGFQILCLNCNFAKAHSLDKLCPHQHQSDGT